MHNIKILYYDRTDVSEGIDVNKASKSKEWNICHYFLNKAFKIQPNVCNRCHDLLMMYLNLSDIAIWNTKTANYWCIISGISKNDAMNLLQNAGLTEKSGTL